MAVTTGESGPIDVTVVIPVRNGGLELLRSIKSVERVVVGSDVAVDVVVVDDGADVALAPSLAVGHLRVGVTVVEGPRDGPSAARNAGAAVARGRYLAFLDVDDVVLPAWVALARAALGTDDDLAGDRAALPTAVRGRCIVEDVVGGARGGMAPSWMPAAYLVEAGAFGRVGGFDPVVRYGEHHQLGARVAAAPGANVVDVADVGPVMVKLDDRSSEQRLGYAARRHDAARLEQAAAVDPAAQAAAADTAAVSLARLGDWRGARGAAIDSLRTEPNAHRRVRVLVLSVPGARHGWYIGRLAAVDRARRARRAVNEARVAFGRAASLRAAAARRARDGDRCPGEADGTGFDLR